ncbi:ABC transporter ATP-binding protein/permease [Emergencia timonensis]|uniref:ABC transporter ATP-binding protein n=1 Tax=Emergencia timonensis TaxID=1776384 RepID=UPI001D0756B9|nr:ABC transporter ATP-binding protein [Emergencia timonensis]MCB6478356.1 ABC transporter ATP-binding protein/permease [Emergencia timonensis]
MKRIFKNLIPYWKTIILIVLLLMVQAYCDLALPQYTSDIIDVGIQNGGVEHITPEKITSKEFKEAQIFMNDDEKELWQSAYAKDGDVYHLNITDEKKLDEIDDKLLTSIVLTYQLGHMSEADFKNTVKETMEKDPQTAPMAEQIDDMSISDIEKLMHTDIDSFKAEDEEGNMATYVDMRPLMEDMIASGQMDDSMVKESRKSMEDTISSMDFLDSMGVAYAVSCNEAAGLDVDDIQMNYLWSEGLKMFMMALLMLAAAVMVSFLAARVGAGVGRDVRGKVFRNVVGFSNAEMDKFSTASLITRSTNDVQQIQMVTAMMLRIVLYAPIIGLGGVYKVAKTGANMEWIIALAVLVIIGFVGTLVSITMPKFKMMQKLVDALNLVSREILTGLSVIRAFGREQTEEERFDVANQNLKKTQLFTNRVMTFMMPGMMMIMNCLVILIMWVSAHRIDTGDLQVGAMTAFITYSMQIVMAFLMLTMMSIMLPRAGVAADRIDEVIRTHSSIEDPAEPKQITEPKGVLEFTDVCFKYPNAKEDVLHNISFKAEPGKVTAIIGSTGSGKSTLVNLIPRFYDVTTGTITLDGEDIRNLSMKELRQEVGFVPQKGVLFSGTIASNLRFGNKDATDEQIRTAAEIAQAEDFIEEKDEKYDSYISQGGSNVSGGQKQRLAIGRAIAKEPKLFVFDDSFSALDMKTDAKLRKALETKVSDCTEVIVAQRISTILHADQILVLDDGEIVGKGTHVELLANCEVYQQIAKSQLSAKELGIEEGVS